MGRRGAILDTLESYQRIGFDTPVFVYHIEQSSRWAVAADEVLRAMAEGRFAGITSTLTVLEIAVRPLRLGRPEIADAYEAFLEDFANLSIVDMDRRVARTGAGLRAKYGLRTPDALHIASCITHGAQTFVTNDRRLRRVTEINVTVIDDFL